MSIGCTDEFVSTLFLSTVENYISILTPQHTHKSPADNTENMHWVL